MNELQLAELIICSFLEKNLTPAGFNDLYEIRNGNNKVLKQHLEALIKIFQKAMQQLESGNKK